jgi:hypothetical protein
VTKVVTAQMPTESTVDNKPQAFQYVSLAPQVGLEPTTLRLTVIYMIESIVTYCCSVLRSMAYLHGFQHESVRANR